MPWWQGPTYHIYFSYITGFFTSARGLIWYILCILMYYFFICVCHNGTYNRNLIYEVNWDRKCILLGKKSPFCFSLTALFDGKWTVTHFLLGFAILCHSMTFFGAPFDITWWNAWRNFPLFPYSTHLTMSWLEPMMCYWKLDFPSSPI
jgi:hypothetical protein